MPTTVSVVGVVVDALATGVEHRAAQQMSLDTVNRSLQSPPHAVSVASAALIRQWVKTARDRRAYEDQVLRSDTEMAQRLRTEISTEDEAEASWWAELGRRLINANVGWDDYCRAYGGTGAPDPIGAWDDAQRRAFLESLQR